MSARTARRRRVPQSGPALGRPRALTTAAALDLAALVVMLGAVVVGFGPVWGTNGYLLPAAGGALLGLVVAWVAAARRWSTLTVLAATVVAYLVAGGALALGHTTTAHVVPTDDTARGLLRGAVLSWKAFVTTAPPLASFPDLALVPFLVMLVAAVVAGTIAWRASRPVWALAPIVAALVGTILLGTILPAHPAAQGVVLAVAGLLWSSWRVTQSRLTDRDVTTDAADDALRRLTAHRARTGAAMLAVCAVAALAVGPMIAPDHGRVVLRQTVQPPPDLHEYPTPLVSFRHYAKDLADDKVLTVSGLPSGARVRLATLDAYDGVVYAATSDEPGSGTFVRAGDQIATDATGEPVTLDVTVDGYDGPWIPDIGSLTGIDFTGARAKSLADGTYYDSTTGTAISTAGLHAGDTYEVDALVQPTPTEADLKGVPVAKVTLPKPTKVPGSVQAKAEQFIGGATDPLTQLQRLRDGLVKSGIYSSGLDTQAPSRPGHSAERIDALLAADQMVGDDEQFAVAYALMAQSLGIPARVVMGVYPATGAWKQGTPFVATGRDVHAWVEVPFEGKGWVPFDAVPKEDNKVQPQPKSEQVPKPPVLQDPQPPTEPDQADTGKTKDDKKKQDKQDANGIDWGHVAFVGTAIVVPLVIVLSPFALLAAYKLRRRTRRRRSGDPSAQISGGWREVLDVAVDLGHDVPTGATRRESAALLEARYPAVPATPLAHHADATVFGAGKPSQAEVETYWAGVAAAVRSMRSAVPLRRRIASHLSLRSIRRERRTGGLRRPPRTRGGDR